MQIAIFYNLPFGGAKRVVREHVKGLRSLGNTVDIYTLNQKQDMFDPSVFANSIFNYPFLLNKSNIPFFSRLIKDLQIFISLKNLHKKIAHEIDSKNYDIVLVHTDIYTQSPYILRFLRTNNVYFCLEPLRMVYEYSLIPDKSIKGLNRLYELTTRNIRKSIDRINARSALHTLTLSLFGREYMIHAYNLYPQISYLGVDTHVFKPKNIKRKNQVLFVAEKEYIYGYDLAVKAIALLPEKDRPELKLVFGTNKSRRISEAELVATYQESLVTLSLSRYDTFGLVPLESWSCGTPVITLNVAGYRETMRDGEIGFWADFDPKDIAKKIQFFLDNRSEIEKMGLAGRKWVEEKWTWKRQIRILEDLLKNIIDYE
ncbi:hypothetical protein BH09PAT1_BH09PAT1_3940 [soil metagenome]